MLLTTNWAGCYRAGWGKRLRPASFAHPAKNSYGLSVRIYEHALEEGWVKAGDYVVDCFSGVGGFALEAMRHGLHFVGCELEQRFVDMGQGCNCSGISKEDWACYQGRWDRMRYKDGHHWCPECLMKASAVTDERKFKRLPLPSTKWAAIAKVYQSTLLDSAPSTSYVRNSGKIPCTGAHRYHGNIETWEQDGMAGTAIIVQGDSRRLGEVLARASLCLSSPPYANQAITRKRCFKNRFNERPLAKEVKAADVGYGQAEGQLSNLPDTGFEAALAISSPPFIDPRGTTVRSHDNLIAGGYSGGQTALNQQMRSDSNGQLAALPEGDHAEACERPVCAISSPPWQGADQRGCPESKWQLMQAAARDGKGHSSTHLPPSMGIDYGSEDGQLGAMPPGSHAEALEAGAVTERAQACISSPPWEHQEPSHAKDGEPSRDRLLSGACQNRTFVDSTYGTTTGQLGQETGSTFWAASRVILEEVYKVLAPGGHAIWVVKMFVRNKQLVDFPGQWEALCQSVGFRTVCKHRAWLNKNAGVVQVAFDGEEVSMEKWFKSFFRRLAESKGSPRIDWELVLCMEKPQ